MSPVAESVVAVLRRHASGVAVVTSETLLFAGGLDLDSVAFLDVILEIEQAVGVRLGEDDLTESILATVGTLVAHVESLVSAGPS